MTIDEATETQRFAQSIRKALSEGGSWSIRGLALEAAGRLERAEREFLALGKLADDTAAELERLRKPVGEAEASEAISALREISGPFADRIAEIISRLAREREELKQDGLVTALGAMTDRQEELLVRVQRLETALRSCKNWKDVPSKIDVIVGTALEPKP